MNGRAQTVALMLVPPPTTRPVCSGIGRPLTLGLGMDTSPQSRGEIEQRRRRRYLGDEVDERTDGNHPAVRNHHLPRGARVGHDPGGSLVAERLVEQVERDGPEPPRRPGHGDELFRVPEQLRDQVDRLHSRGHPLTKTVSAEMWPTSSAPAGSPSGAARPGRGNVKNAALSAANCLRTSSLRTLRYEKIATSGQASSHAPQSMHSFGLM